MKKKDWEIDKEWTIRFIPEMKEVVTLHLVSEPLVFVSEPPIEEDEQRNTDLIVLKMGIVRVSCRVRRPEFYPGQAHEITMRESRKRGTKLNTKVELRKVIEGWGDYLFYGFSDKAEKHLEAWNIVDLREFRWWLHSFMKNNGGKLPGRRIPNRDHKSWFQAFEIDEMSRHVICRTSEEEPVDEGLLEPE